MEIQVNILLVYYLWLRIPTLIVFKFYNYIF